MKFQDALDFIKGNIGFRVSFEIREGGILTSDHFPERDEEPIKKEDDAWKYARQFAQVGKSRGIVNVYVIHADDWTPVDGYKEKELNYYG
jgi:hypothetical protein